MKLIVLKNNVPLHEVTVDTTDFDEMYEIYVGRAEDCHVQIDDPLISRHHFVLKNQDANWYCEKLSQLGTVTLNGSLVSKNTLNSGDEVKCGIYSVIVSELPLLQKVEPKTNTHEQPVYQEAYTEMIAPPVSQPLAKPVEMQQPTAETAEPELGPDLNDSLLLEDDSALSLDGFDDLSMESLDEPLEQPEEASTDFADSDPVVEEPAAQDFSGGELSTETFAAEGDADFPLANQDNNDSTKFFKAFVNYQLVLFGEHAPYDRFQIDQDEIFIGRDPKKCQIILNDPEVSTVHAVIRKKFSEAGRLMPVESNQSIETEEFEEEIVSTEDGDINFDSDVPREKSIIKRIMKEPAMRKKAIYAFVGLGLAYLFLAPEEQPEIDKKTVVAKEAPKKDVKTKLTLSKEVETARNVAYELGVSFFEQSHYDQALQEFEKVVSIDPSYKKVQSYLEQTKVGLKRLKELEEQRRAEEDRIKTKKLIEELLVKAREAVKERQVQVAENIFSQIIEKDPENIEVSQLKLELESWQKEEERKALELAAKENARKRMVDALSPGKTFYLKKEWYRAILKLEEFLRIKSMDEDLIKEASDMLSDAKNQLTSDLGPLLGKARSLKEGQDFKSAYEAFLEILKVEPTNSEALNEVDDIKSQLDGRSKRIYREAIIAESLSLFADAKEKFQEVQQISPTDSEYYKKASDKLKNYLE